VTVNPPEPREVLPRDDERLAISGEASGAQYRHCDDWTARHAAIASVAVKLGAILLTRLHQLAQLQIGAMVDLSTFAAGP
jgi:hypothetical protein